MSGPRSAGRWLLPLALLVCVALGLAWLGGSLGRTDSETPAPSVAAPTTTGTPEQVVCERAAQLVDAGRAERALALLRSAEPIRGDRKSQICEEQFAAAMVATTTDTKLAEVPAWFSGLVGGRTSVPEVVGIALGLLVALAVLARLLVPWVPTRGRADPHWSAPFVVAGLIGLAGAATSLAVTVTGTGGPCTWWVFWGATALALSGVLLLARGQATRLRLTVTCTASAGTTSAPLTGRVVARIGELGIEPAAGVEVPRGTDVEVLGAGALGSLPEGRVAKLLVGLAQSVFATSPWQVLVEEQADTSFAVSVSRNGHARGATTVTRDLLDLPDDDARKTRDQVDLVTLVAAFVLANLADAYEGFDGLGGATDWLSIGLHTVATTDDDLSEKQAVELLALAVDRDPGNWPAEVALRNRLWRESTDPGVLEQYVRWLGPAIDATESAHPNLALRMRTTVALARINQHFAQQKTGKAPVPPAPHLADDVRGLLVALGNHPKPDGQLARQTAQIAWPTALMLLDMPCAVRLSNEAPASLPPWRDVEPVLQVLEQAAPAGAPTLPTRVLQRTYARTLGADASYALGCAWAYLADTAATTEQRDGLRAAAVTAFRVAVARKDVRAWLDKDPQLAAFRASDAYGRAFLPKPRTDLFALEPLATHATALRAAGFATARQLCAAAPGPTTVALPINPPTLRSISELARLRQTMTSAWMDRYGVEVLAELAKDGRASRLFVSSLRAHRGRRRALARQLQRAVLERCRAVDATGAPVSRATAASGLTSSINDWLLAVGRCA